MGYKSLVRKQKRRGYGTVKKEYSFKYIRSGRHAS